MVGRHPEVKKHTLLELNAYHMLPWFVFHRTICIFLGRSCLQSISSKMPKDIKAADQSNTYNTKEGIFNYYNKDL